MSDPLLAADTTKPQDATTTQGEVAQTDQQPAPEQSQTDRAEPTESKDVAEALYKEEPKPDESKAEDKPEEGEADAGEKAEDKPKAPEKYEFSVPEGMPEDFEQDEAVFAALGEVSRELDLTQESAQKLVDKVWPVMHRRSQEQLEAVNDKWAAETKADKEILELGEKQAGAGSSFEKALATAKRALNAFGSDGLLDLLKGPLGSHPEVTRFLVKVGQTVSEDKFLGGRKGREPVDPNDMTAVADVLYGKDQ